MIFITNFQYFIFLKKMKVIFYLLKNTVFLPAHKFLT